ncbi:nitroreductase/quinone reductase family protein [Micromonospora chokoriensis]
MIEDIRQALAITPASTAWQRTADITTTGRRSGRPSRIEIWFYRYDGEIYLSGLPGRRDWYANLHANPRLTFHLKHGAHADLPATARIITDDEERLRAFTHFVADMNQPHNPARIRQPTDVDSWMIGSPLAQVSFDDERLP